MMYSFCPGNSPLSWLSLFPEGVSSRRRWLRRLIEWKLRKVDGITAYYSLYSVPRNVLSLTRFPARRNIFLPNGTEDGPETVIDELYQRGKRLFIRDYHTPEGESFSDLKEALEGGGFDFHLLYTAGLDSSLHRYGTSHHEIEKHLDWYSRELEEISSIGAGCNMAVLGDHGMCDVNSSIDLMDRVEKLDLEIPADYIPFYDSTMARFRIFTGRARQKLCGLLTGMEEGVILSAEEKRKLGIDFEGGIFGDIIFIINQGTIINPSYMGEELIRGMHGYHPDNECMYSGLFSNMEEAEKAGSITDVASMFIPGFTCSGRDEDGTG
jgi:hypothetical protein